MAIQVLLWDRYKNVTEFNLLKGIPTFPFWIMVSNNNTDINPKNNMAEVSWPQS